MGAEKLVKNELCTYIANTAEDITSDHKFLLRLVKTFTIATEEYYRSVARNMTSGPSKVL